MWYAYVILAVMAAVVFTAATLRFRRDLAPGGRAHGRRGAAATAEIAVSEAGAP
jgi:ABC-2 type transport system permease protein